MSARNPTLPENKNVARQELRTPKYRIRVVAAKTVYTRKTKHKGET